MLQASLRSGRTRVSCIRSWKARETMGGGAQMTPFCTLIILAGRRVVRQQGIWRHMRGTPDLTPPKHTETSQHHSPPHPAARHPATPCFPPHPHIAGTASQHHSTPTTSPELKPHFVKTRAYTPARLHACKHMRIRAHTHTHTHTCTTTTTSKITTNYLDKQQQRRRRRRRRRRRHPPIPWFPLRFQHITHETGDLRVLHVYRVCTTYGGTF